MSPHRLCFAQSGWANNIVDDDYDDSSLTITRVAGTWTSFLGYSLQISSNTAITCVIVASIIASVPTCTPSCRAMQKSISKCPFLASTILGGGIARMNVDFSHHCVISYDNWPQAAAGRAAGAGESA